MKPKRLKQLLSAIDGHQARLEKIHELAGDSLNVSPSVKAAVITQIVDLATATTYLLTAELTPEIGMIGMPDQLINYTFSPADLDAELDEYYEDDDEEEDPDGPVNERR